MDSDCNEISCILFLEKQHNLIIIENGLNNGAVITHVSNDIIAIKSVSFTVHRSLQCDHRIVSGKWIMFLDANQHNYQLVIESDNSCTLLAGMGVITMIDCLNGPLFSYPKVQNQLKVASESEPMDIDGHNELIVKDNHFISFSTNLLEVMEKLRSFSKEYFNDTCDEATKKSLGDKLNKYLEPILVGICARAITELLEAEPRVVQTSSPSIVFGDIHGNLRDLFDYESMFWNSKKAMIDKVSYLFLGDFVDRGPHSVECALFLLVNKLLAPKKFILVRGNHEVRELNRTFSFYNECIQKYGDKRGYHVWDAFNCCFESLPVAAVVAKTVFCCHGGVPKSITKLEDILKVPKPLVRPDSESPGAHEIMWNDPIESMLTYNPDMALILDQENTEFIPNRVRNTGFYFTEHAVKKFFQQNSFTTMIRAHECVPEGYRNHFDGKVITVFSSSNYCGKNNTTACIGVHNSKISPIILRCPSGLHTSSHKCNLQ